MAIWTLTNLSIEVSDTPADQIYFIHRGEWESQAFYAEELFNQHYEQCKNVKDILQRMPLFAYAFLEDSIHRAYLQINLILKKNNPFSLEEFKTSYYNNANYCSFKSSFKQFKKNFLERIISDPQKLEEAINYDDYQTLKKLIDEKKIASPKEIFENLNFTSLIFNVIELNFFGIVMDVLKSISSDMISGGIKQYKANQEIFNDPTTKESLLNAFKTSVCNVYHAVLDVFVSKGLVDKRLSIENIKEVQSLSDFILKEYHTLNDKELHQSIQTCLEKDPINRRAIQALILKNGDPNLEITQHYNKYKVDVSQIKFDVIKAKLVFNPNDMQDISQYHVKIKEINQLIQSIDYDQNKIKSFQQIFIQDILKYCNTKCTSIQDLIARLKFLTVTSMLINSDSNSLNVLIIKLFDDYQKFYNDDLDHLILMNKTVHSFKLNNIMDISKLLDKINHQFFSFYLKNNKVNELFINLCLKMPMNQKESVLINLLNQIPSKDDINDIANYQYTIILLKKLSDALPPEILYKLHSQKIIYVNNLKKCIDNTNQNPNELKLIKTVRISLELKESDIN